MKVHWLKAASLAIAASLGGAQIARGEYPTFHLSDAVEPTSYSGGPYDAPPAPLPGKAFPAELPYGGGSPCACDACAADEAEEVTCEPFRLFCQKECGVNIYGWASGGIMANSAAPPSNFNGPVTFADRDDGQFNQLYAIAERTIDTGGCGLDFGGRVDVLYGSDYIFTQSLGFEVHDDGTPHWNGDPDYGLAVPQAYAEIGYNNLSLKAGHFYTTLGYEVVPATGNFFYTHAYTMQYGEPFTHWGLLATWAASDELSLIGAFVNGWDALDREVDTGAGIVGFTWAGAEDLTIACNFIMSPNEPTLDGTLTNRNAYSVVATWNATEAWQYVLQHDFGWQHDGDPGSQFTQSAEWYGVNQYLFYTINDCWKAGTRFEWFRDDDGVRVGALRPGNPIPANGFAGNFFELSCGLNWTPSANVLVRPEIRYDWYDGESFAGPLPYDDGDRSDQLLYGLDVTVLW